MTYPADPSRQPLPRPRRRWLTILLVLIVFISGTVIGAALATMFIVHEVRYAVRHPDEIPARLTARLTRRLSLTPAQAEQVRPLIDARVEHVQSIRREFEPKFRAELSGLHSDIRKVLTPEQQTKWDTLFDDLVDNWLPASPLVPSTEP